jgi:hypothetical protein
MSSIALANTTPFAWNPDWAANMLERLEWYTDVLPAYRGEEQRRSLRLSPRQSLEFAVLVSDANRRHLEAALWGRGAAYFTVPLWFDALALSASLASGATSIPLSTALRQFAVGDFVMLLGATPLDVEVIAITSIGASIGLGTATTRTWPAGTRVMPARAARLDASISLPRFTGGASSVRLRFDMCDPAEYTASAGATTYRSLPVFEEQIDWSEDPNLVLERRQSVFDAGTGPVVIDDIAEMPIPQQSGRYTMVSRASIDTWRQRLYALRGKQGALWVPTLASDFAIVAPVTAIATTIDVSWCGYTDFLLGDCNRQDIRIQLANGSVLYRRITGSSEISSSVERLTLGSALGVAVAVADVVLVSFIAPMRMQSDAAEIAWWTDSIADVSCSFQGFRHEL